MQAPGTAILLFVTVMAAPAQITVNYPELGSISPPDMIAPTFIWRDAAPAARVWIIEAAGLRVTVPGERLRDIGQPRSRLLMEGLPTCANCHSLSRDGRTLGMDVDGPRNDKGLYAMARVEPNMSINNRDIISWNSFQDQPAGRMRVGFMSQVSPDGKYVVTTVGSTERASRN